jgi:hypothetical protein
MRLAFLLALAVTLPVFSQNRPPDWVAKSNQNAEVFLKVMARYQPEDAGQLGVPGLDEQVSSPSPQLPALSRRDIAEAVKILQSRLATERNPLVQQDLQILIQEGQREIHASDAYERRLLPYMNVSRRIFAGMQSLLNPQVPANRQQAALVRLRRYAGVDAGYTPLTVLAERVYRDKLKHPELLGPPRAEVEQDLATVHSRNRTFLCRRHSRPVLEIQSRRLPRRL